MQEAKGEGRAMLNRQDEPPLEKGGHSRWERWWKDSMEKKVDGAGEIKRIVLISSYSIKICTYC